jgi:hypothetical protein
MLIRPHLADVLQGERLRKRSQIAHAVIKDADLPIPSEEVKDAFGRLAKMADYRNILAHNAPNWNVYAHDEDPNDLRVALELRSHRGHQTTLVEVLDRADEAKELAAAMMNLYRDIYRCLNPAEE